jgi:hypothetical protein
MKVVNAIRFFPNACSAFAREAARNHRRGFATAAVLSGACKRRERRLRITMVVLRF